MFNSRFDVIFTPQKSTWTDLGVYPYIPRRYAPVTNNQQRGGSWWGMGCGHTVGARWGQQGVRARVRAAGKALERDDRHMHIHTRFLHEDSDEW